jgi:lipopolysaccharide biosynthesis regulator YciM
MDLHALTGAASPVLFAVLLAAIAVGFFLGRRSRREPKGRERPGGDYMRGLNYLLSEQADGAIDAFVSALDVSDDTVETHLALGALVRRRGEVDKAIRVHQNLLARPQLSPHFRAQAELELARDYLAAGLLGRAESLLKDLGGRGGELREQALEYLLEIYQRERDWEEAIVIAREMAGRGEVDIRRILAQYLCELADRARDNGDVRAARRDLDQALDWDGRCVRASLMLGRLESGQGRWKDAIRALRRVQEQDPRFLGEALPTLAEAHAELGTERDLVRFLEHCVDEHPSTAVAVDLADRIAARSGEDAARAFLAGVLERNPTVRGFNALLARHVDDVAGLDPAVERLKTFTDAMIAEAPAYECESCAFVGRVLHWQCPSCKSWGTTVPARGLVGE